MSAPALAPGHELLDDPAADPAEVRLSLANIARANRWFGGWWALRRGLERLTADWAAEPTPGPLTLLDVGCGTGDLTLRAVHWARRRGITLIPIGLERHPAAAGLARDAGIPTVLGCAGSLPLRPASADLVVASQLVHHLAAADIVAFFQAADRVARRGVIVADLRRSRAAQAGFWAGARLLGFDAATRADGITSVRRGFSAGELADLLARAGVSARVEQTPGFRLVATWKAAGR